MGGGGGNGKENIEQGTILFKIQFFINASFHAVFMTLPYHRSNTNMAQQRGNNTWGSREQRSEEASRTLMETENDARWLELGEQVSLLKSVQ